MPLRSVVKRQTSDSARNRLAGAAESLAAAAAQPAWLDGWAAVWGVMLARPDLSIGGTGPRVAAVGVIVWMLTWARDLEDPARSNVTTIPGGRGALAAAALVVAAMMGTGPLVAAAAWLAVGVIRLRTGTSWGVAAGQLRLWIGALGAWLSLGGVAAARGAAFGEPAAHAAVAWLQLNGFDVALILAGCALAVGGTGTGGREAGDAATDGAATDGVVTDGASHWPGTARVAAFVLLAIGLIVADRPSGLWLAALCAAALWPGRSRQARPNAVSTARLWLPCALGAACIVDLLVP